MFRLLAVAIANNDKGMSPWHLNTVFSQNVDKRKEAGPRIRLCPPGSQKKNLMDSRVFQGQGLSCH